MSRGGWRRRAAARPPAALPLDRPSSDVQAPPAGDGQGGRGRARSGAGARTWTWAGVALVALPLLVLYGRTLEPSVYFGDSGILLSSASDFGIAYSPGFPVYVMAVSVWGRLARMAGIPFAVGVNSFSAVAAAGASVLVFLAVRRLLAPAAGGAGPPPPARARRAGAPLLPASPPVVWVAAVLAGWMTGAAYTMWSQAINADMYTLCGLLAAAILYLAIRLERATTARDRTRAALLIAVAYGLMWAVHYLALGWLPFILHLAWRHRPQLRRVRWRLLAFFGLSAALPYAYLPIRSAMWPVVDWGHPASPGNLLAALTGATWTTQASNYRVFDPGALVGAVGAWLRLDYSQVALPVLLLAAAGWLFCRGHRRGLATGLALAWLGPGVLATVYVTNNGPSYLIPAHVVMALLAAVGLVEGERRLAPRTWWGRTRAGRRRGPAVALLALGLAAGTVAPPFATLDRHRAYVAEDYGRNALRGVPAGGIMFVPGDTLNASVEYLQVVTDYRPDVAVIPTSLVHFKWWRQSFRRHHPGFVLPELPPAANDVTWMTRLVRGVLAGNPGRTVYLVSQDGLNLPAGFVAVPAGIGYRLVAAGATAAQRIRLSDWAFSARSLGQASGNHHDDLQPIYDIAWREVRLGYVQAFEDLGDSEFDAHRYLAAARAYATALRFYRGDPRLTISRGASLLMAGRDAAAAALLPGPYRSRGASAADPRALATAYGQALTDVGLCFERPACFGPADADMNVIEAQRFAIQWFRMAQRVDRADAAALLNLGGLLAESGAPASGVVYLNRLIALAPPALAPADPRAQVFAQALFDRAQAETVLGEPAAARRDMARALALDPSLRSLLPPAATGGPPGG